jgi:hypothetical protein
LIFFHISEFFMNLFDGTEAEAHPYPGTQGKMQGGERSRQAGNDCYLLHTSLLVNQARR